MAKAETQTVNAAIDTAPDIDGIDTLIERMDNAHTVEEWSFILGDYLSFGNTKIAKNVAIFNLNSATDCPNRESENCQVSWEKCYAGKAERTYKQTLPYRRRQEYLWDSMPADLWAKAFLKVVERKRNPVDTIRFSEAGDFRNNGDIVRVNTIAKIVGEHGIDVYTYSASDYLNWDLATDFTVMASNDLSEYGDQRYIAVDTSEDVPTDGVHCPYDATGGDIKCGECRSCIDSHGTDVYITLH